MLVSLSLWVCWLWRLKNWIEAVWCQTGGLQMPVRLRAARSPSFWQSIYSESMSWVKACTSGCSSAQHRGGPRGQPHSRNAVMQMNPPTLKQLLEFLCLLFGLLSLSLSLNFSRFLPTFPSLHLCLFSFPKRSLSLSLSPVIHKVIWRDIQSFLNWPASLSPQ